MSKVNPFHVWIRLKLPKEEIHSLRKDFGAVEFVTGKDIDNQVSWLPNVDAVFTDEPLNDPLVDQMTNLKWLHTSRGGVYPFMTPAVMRRLIQVTSSKGIHGPAFSEFGLSCIFALAKRLPQCWEVQRRKKWERPTPEMITGKTLGILGLGSVGSELARKAKELGLRVLATKRTVEPKPIYVDEVWPPDCLPMVLAQADFVVVCLPNIPSTENILGEKELRSMKKTAFLVNLTAGRVVEETLLVRALKELWIAGAALDAFSQQPLAEESELWGLPNVIISPRIAGVTEEKWELILPIFADNLRRFLSGDHLRNLVDKEHGY